MFCHTFQENVVIFTLVLKEQDLFWIKMIYTDLKIKALYWFKKTFILCFGLCFFFSLLIFAVSCDVQDAIAGQVSRYFIRDDDRAHVRMLLLA